MKYTGPKAEASNLREGRWFCLSPLEPDPYHNAELSGRESLHRRPLKTISFDPFRSFRQPIRVWIVTGKRPVVHRRFSLAGPIHWPDPDEISFDGSRFVPCLEDAKG